MKTTLVLLTTYILLQSASLAHAESSELKRIGERFQPYEPNYLVGQSTRNDDFALEARYSFKYLLTRPVEDDALRTADNRREWYVKYTGEFDFYWGSRFSSPVVNRVSNPALHVRHHFPTGKHFLGMDWKYLDIGAQHLSNGQSQDPTLPRNGVSRPQVIFDQDPHDPFFDRISRSVNFISVETKFRFGNGVPAEGNMSPRCPGLSSCYNLWARAIPYFFDDDNPVTWGPESLRTSRLSDYDRVRIILSKTTNLGRSNNGTAETGFKAVEVGVEWTVGDQLFETDSFDVFILLPYETGRGWRLPFYLRYHNGPMNNFSNYTKKQNSIGLGIRLD